MAEGSVFLNEGWTSLCVLYARLLRTAELFRIVGTRAS